MRRKTFEELKVQFVQAMSASDWNKMANLSTEMLTIEDNHGWLWANRGIAVQRLGCPLDAILSYDRAIQLDGSAIAYNNKGAALQEMEKLDEAMACFNKALEVNPEIAQTYMNIGHIYKWQGKHALAIQSYEKCIELDYNYVDGHLALAMLLLKTGKLKQGWEEYEWRWKSDQLPPRGLKQPRWKGEDLTNKTILVYAEQGFGDSLQFGRYLRVLANQYPRARIIVEGKQPLKRLLETIPEVYSVINFGEKLPHVDYVIPMVSLGAFFTPNIHHIVAEDCVYPLNGNDVDVWANKFAELPKGLRVGICWAGMSRVGNATAVKIDELRSIALADLAPLAKIKNIMWISLQKGPPAGQITTPPAGMTIADFTEDMHDFYETCCAIENCDLVIAVDTAVAHAAASIGKPTWVFSRWDGCWRWFDKRVDSPWYPSIKLFEQTTPHDWDGVVKQMAVELAELAKDKNELELNLTMAS